MVTIDRNLEMIERIDKDEIEVNPNFISMAYATLQIYKIEATLAAAEQDPSSFTKALELLMKLIDRLAEAFGNNNVPIIEIFIKPFLLLCNTYL